MNAAREALSETVTRWAVTITSALDAATYVACPHMKQRMGEPLGTEAIAARLADYIVVAEEIAQSFSTENTRPIVDAASQAARLRELVLAAGLLQESVPAEIVRGARAFLVTFGYPEPARGWDAVDITLGI